MRSLAYFLQKRAKASHIQHALREGEFTTHVEAFFLEKMLPARVYVHDKKTHTLILHTSHPTLANEIRLYQRALNVVLRQKGFPPIASLKVFIRKETL